MKLRHPEQDLAELGGHLGVVGHGVLLQGVHHLDKVNYTAAAKVPSTKKERERERDQNMVLNLLRYHHRDK